MTVFNYFRKEAVRTLFKIQPTSTDRITKIISRYESCFIPKRVLVVAKITRYQLQKLQEPNLSENQLKSKLLHQGANYDSLVANHKANKDIESQVIKVLKQMNVEYKVVNRNSINRSYIKWADLVLPIGGDGTFLLTSNLVLDKTPIMGINSYPEKSEGHLMLPAKYTNNILSIFEMLKNGEYNIIMRSRIRTILQGEGIWNAPFHMHEKKGITESQKWYNDDTKPNLNDQQLKERCLPWLALNEVFIAESQAARTSSLLIKIDKKNEFQNVKSSGLCISTGTGSTSWYKSINSVNTEMVTDLLKFIDTNKHLSTKEIEKICDSYNKNLCFSPEDQRLCYVVRDMISRGVQSKKISARGFCEEITVQSECFDAGLVIDGGIAVPFNMGSKAILQCHKTDSLRTITLPK